MEVDSINLDFESPARKLVNKFNGQPSILLNTLPELSPILIKFIFFFSKYYMDII